MEVSTKRLVLPPSSGCLAEQRPAFVRAADGQFGAAPSACSQHDGEAPLEDFAEERGGQLEAGAAQVAQDFLEIGPEEAREKKGVVQFVAEIDERFLERMREEMRGERVPEQRDGGHPARVRQGLDGAEFDEAAAAAVEIHVPEFVEARLAAVRVAGGVGVQMAQRLADEIAMIAGRAVPRGSGRPSRDRRARWRLHRAAALARRSRRTGR